MWLIILSMVAGLGIGWLLRKKTFRSINKVTMIFVWLLLFLLGVEVGNSNQIIESLPNLGGTALLITLGAILGSALMSLILFRWINYSEKQKHS